MTGSECSVTSALRDNAIEGQISCGIVGGQKQIER
jgi:hypothetical protein